MKHIPTKYKRKAKRASYAAGYRHGYAGLEARVSTARPEDAQKIYEHGYGDGRGDRHNREVDREPAAVTRCVLDESGSGTVDECADCGATKADDRKIRHDGTCGIEVITQ